MLDCSTEPFVRSTFPHPLPSRPPADCRSGGAADLSSEVRKECLIDQDFVEAARSGTTMSAGPGIGRKLRRTIALIRPRQPVDFELGGKTIRDVSKA
jgi:hypothetical protein